MPYAIPENGEWAEYIVTLCPDCLACHVITDGEVYDFRRFPQSLIIREPNGRFMQSQRRIIVRREPDRSIYLLAIKTTGDALPTVLLPKESAEWQVREAYAKVLRSLDTADPIPPFVPHPPHEARELKLAK